MKRMTAAELKEFETSVNTEFCEVFRKLNTIELMKDVKAYKEQNDELFNELRE